MKPSKTNIVRVDSLDQNSTSTAYSEQKKWLIEVISKLLSPKRLFLLLKPSSFQEERIKRFSFFGGVLSLIVLYLAFYFFQFLILTKFRNSISNGLLLLILIITNAFTLYYVLQIFRFIIRRLQDAGFRDLLIFPPFISFMMGIVFLFTSSLSEFGLALVSISSYFVLALVLFCALIPSDRAPWPRNH